MYAIALLQGMVFYGPVTTLYRQVNGLSVFQITLIEGISYLLCIVFEIPWGIIADKIGYKRTMCFCCSLFFISKIVFWSAHGFSSFLIERIMLSIVFSGLSGVDTSILYLSCSKGESQKAFGVYSSLGEIGVLFAALVFSVFVRSNYSLAAFLTVISYGLAALLSFFLTEVRDSENRAVLFSELKVIFANVFKDKKFILFLLSAAFLSEICRTITVFLNQIQYEKCGLSASAIGYIYIIVTLAGMTAVFSEVLTRKLGIRRIGIVFYIAAIISCTVLGFTDKAFVSVLGILLLNVTDSLYQPYQMELQNRQVRSANRATELSVYAMVINCVSAGTSVLFGTLADISLSLSFLFGAGLGIIGLLFFIRWYKHRKKALES